MAAGTAKYCLNTYTLAIRDGKGQIFHPGCGPRRGYSYHRLVRRPALGIAIGPADLFEFKHAGLVEWLGVGGAVVPSARAGSTTPLSSFLRRRVAGSWGKPPSEVRGEGVIR